MKETSGVEGIVEVLARDLLRNLVLLKQIAVYPRHMTVRQLIDGEDLATLVLLDTAASAYDRKAYPEAAFAAFLSSDRRDLTAALLDHVPRDVGVVFKLPDTADAAVVASRFLIERRTAFLSFTSSAPHASVPDVEIATAPDRDAYRLFAGQGHDETWLAPLFAAGDAVAAVLSEDGVTRSACFAFRNYESVWEVGGVVTAASCRRRGLGARVVRAILAELSRRGLAPRYQVEEHNAASIALARSVGLTQFLTLTHYTRVA